MQISVLSCQDGSRNKEACLFLSLEIYKNNVTATNSHIGCPSLSEVRAGDQEDNTTTQKVYKYRWIKLYFHGRVDDSLPLIFCSKKLHLLGSWAALQIYFQW